MADIFFSYKREDRASVEPLVRLLENEGLTVWWDSTIVAGERFDQVIHRELEQANCVMVAWSANSADAVWVRDEASSGRDRGILVPLTLDGARPPLGFRQYQTPDLSGWTGDASDPRIKQLIAGTRRVVKGERSASEALAAPTVGVPHPRTDLRPKPEPRRRTLPRRRVLQLGAAAGAVGLASAAGLWVGMPMLRRGELPPTRSEKFDLVTVDARGDPKAPQPQTIEVFDVPLGNASLEFSVIPAGGFQIGSPDGEEQRRDNEGPQQFIELRTFALTRTTVTQAQWATLVENSPGVIAQSLAPYPSFFRGDDLPVETISWDHAVEFCRRLSRETGLRCRLPSEAEWEYACRARTMTPFHFGPTVTPDIANYCATGGAVHGKNDGKEISSDTYNGVEYRSAAYGDGPVGVAFRDATVAARSFPPNRFGLFQMHGNVWEHCFDTGPTDYRHIPPDGSPYMGTEDRRILRGGAWSHNPAICRSAYRDAMLPNSVGWQGRVGLRVVCELGEPERAVG